MPDAPTRQIHTRFVPINRRIETIDSLEGGGMLDHDLVLRFRGDTADPGPFQYYGTDLFGERGWFGSFGASGLQHSAGLVPDPGDTPGTTRFLREDGQWITGGAGATTFLGLSDTPSSYSAQALKVVRVNAGETALEFVTATGGGDFSTNTALSVANEVVLFADATGKLGKRPGLMTGVAKLSSGQLSASAVDLSGAEATGILAAARFPALTGDVTNTVGTVATTVGKILNVTVPALSQGFLRYNAAGPNFSWVNSNFITGVLAGKFIRVDSVNGNDGTGTRGQWDLPFLTISGAIGAAGITADDVILVGPGTYTENNGIVIPDDVSLCGSGIGVTTINSTLTMTGGGGATNQSIVYPGNNSIIADLSIVGNAASSVFQVPLGDGALGAAPVAKTGIRAYRVEMVAGSDGIRFNAATTIKCYDCVITTLWDGVTLNHGSANVELFNPIITVTGPFDAGGHPVRGLSGSGTINVYGGRITASGVVGDTNHICVAPTSGTYKLYGTVVHADTGTFWDFNNSSGTIGISGVSRDDGAAFTTTGTITELSRDLIKDNNLSDLLSAATARTNLGGTTVGQAFFTLTNPGAITFPRIDVANTVTARSAANYRSDLGLVIGTNVEAWDAQLDSLAALTYTGNAGKFIRVNAGETDFELAAVAGSGTVTSITATSPAVVTPSPLVTTGVISLDTSVDFNFTNSQSIILDDGNASAEVVILTLSHNTTGVPANGLGGRIRLRGESSTVTNQDMAWLNYGWIDVVNASRTAYLDIKVVDNAVGPAIAARFFGEGSMTVGATTKPGAAGIINANTGFRIANAASLGKFLIGDGTNYAASAWQLPTASAGAGTLLRNTGLGNNTAFTTPSYPNVGTLGAVLIGDGTNITADTTPTLVDVLTLAAGTTTIAPLVYQSGTNLTTATAGAQEYDGVQYYATIDSTSKRGAIPVEQYFHLTAAGTAITTIANFFGATSNISLVASAYYEIEIYCYFLKDANASVVTWTFTNSAAPTGQNIITEFSPIAGIVTGTPTATMLNGQIYNDATAAKTIASGTLAASVNHFAHFKIMLKNGTGTSLKIQATVTTGNITPGIGSWWRCRRISPNNIGTFAA